MCERVARALSRDADILLQLGELLTAEQARDCKLVDEVTEPDAVEGAAVDMVNKLAAIPNAARHASKMLVRRHNLAEFDRIREADVQQAKDFIMAESTQQALDGYMAALKARKK